jgi:hypothetical protein
MGEHQHDRKGSRSSLRQRNRKDAEIYCSNVRGRTGLEGLTRESIHHCGVD